MPDAVLRNDVQRVHLIEPVDEALGEARGKGTELVIAALILEIQHGDSLGRHAMRDISRLRHHGRARFHPVIPRGEASGGEKHDRQRTADERPPSPSNDRCRNCRVLLRVRACVPDIRARRALPEQCILELRDRREAISGYLLEGMHDRAFELVRHRAPNDLDRRRHFHRVPRHDRDRVRPGEWHLTNEHLIQHAREAIHVTAPIDVIAAELLGTHVGGGANRHARLRQLLAAGVLDHSRNAKVGDNSMAAMQQYVLWFDVAMDDAEGVRIRQRIRNLTGDRDRVVDRELALALQPTAQRLALDEGHHIIQQPMRVAGVEHRQDVRMIQPRGNLDLALEAIAVDR